MLRPISAFLQISTKFGAHFSIHSLLSFNLLSPIRWESHRNGKCRKSLTSSNQRTLLLEYAQRVDFPQIRMYSGYDLTILVKLFLFLIDLVLMSSSCHHVLVGGEFN